MANDYSCFMFVEMTIFVMFVFGFVLVYHLPTEFLGFTICGFTHTLLFILITFNVLRKRTEDLLGFSLFAAVGLLFVSILFSILFYFKINNTHSTFKDPTLLDGKPRELFTKIKALYVSTLVLIFVLYALYMVMNDKFDFTSKTGTPFIVDALFGLFSRGEAFETKHTYLFGTTILAMAVLGTSSYSVYLTNLLNSVQILN